MLRKNKLRTFLRFRLLHCRRDTRSPSPTVRHLSRGTRHVYHRAVFTTPDCFHVSLNAMFEVLSQSTILATVSHQSFRLVLQALAA